MLYEYNCIIRSITDGDGLRVDIDLGFGVTLRGDDGRGVNIRLYGIDAPESRTRNKKEKLHGPWQHWQERLVTHVTHHGVARYGPSEYRVSWCETHV